MVARIAGETVYLWRAVDHEGEVLDIVVQSGRDKAAALKLMRKLLKKQVLAPTVIVTEKLRLHSAAFAEFGLAAYRAKPEAEQPGGSFTPAGPPMRAKGAAIQVSRICSAL